MYHLRNLSFREFILFKTDLRFEPVGLEEVFETFFINQLEGMHQLSLPNSADFLVDNQYLIEIGGPNKTRKQLQQATNAYVLRDQIETGHKNIIPLWLFGFLY